MGDTDIYQLGKFYQKDKNERNRVKRMTSWIFSPVKIDSNLTCLMKDKLVPDTFLFYVELTRSYTFKIANCDLKDCWKGQAPQVSCC